MKEGYYYLRGDEVNNISDEYEIVKGPNGFESHP
jgi:hypothetical protein